MMYWTEVAKVHLINRAQFETERRVGAGELTRRCTFCLFQLGEIAVGDVVEHWKTVFRATHLALSPSSPLSLFTARRV